MNVVDEEDGAEVEGEEGTLVEEEEEGAANEVRNTGGVLTAGGKSVCVLHSAIQRDCGKRVIHMPFYLQSNLMALIRNQIS